MGSGLKPYIWCNRGLYSIYTDAADVNPTLYKNYTTEYKKMNTIY